MGSRVKILVVGRSGRLAQALLASAGEDVNIRALGRPSLDLRRPQTVLDAVRDHRPDLVINASGLSSPGAAAANSREALARTAQGARLVACAAQLSGAAVVQISTVEVFDGPSPCPIAEDVAPNPCGMFGASHLLAEEMVQDAAPRSVILRTGPMVAASTADRPSCCLTGRSDRVVMPTSVFDVARVCLWIAPLLVSARPSTPVWGVTHCAGGGACRISDLKDALYAQGFWVEHLDYAEGANSTHSILDCSRLARVFGHRLPQWEQSLPELASQAKDMPVALSA